jgi:AcrR family transcriptional regulator
MFNSEDPPGGKRERTRALLVETALRSFRQRGYDETTIRLIAAEAEVSTGNAYYHFPTKNHLVQELYLQVQGEHRDAAVAGLAATDDLIERLRVVYHAGIDTLAPFHRFAPGFLSAAMSPRSPINPLSADSEPARDLAVGVFQDAVSGARRGFPAEFTDRVPELLLLAYLLLALFWVYDASPGQKRTHRLIDRGLALLKLGLPLTRTPVLRAPLREFFAMMAEVRA